MRELKIIDVENSTITVAHPDGEEFLVSLDAASITKLRGTRSANESVRVSPKEVQAHIRSGMSAEEVSALTGATLDFISRFEGPVLAEREFIINSALAIDTQSIVESETGETSSAFGALIHSRLRELSATGERWASWKASDGTWVVKLEFVASDIDHDARWSFEPRKHALSPMNSDAATLSHKGDLSTGIIPRLRAVGDVDPAAQAESFSMGSVDSLESTAVPPRGGLAKVSHLEFAAVSEEFTYETNVFVDMADLLGTDNPTGRPQADSESGTSPTADLLEALRKRRGESDVTPAWLREEVRSSDVQGPIDPTQDDTSPQPLSTEPITREGTQRTGSHARRERTSMPSWDEIVFGTRSDDDVQ